MCDLDAAALISKKISAVKDEKEELEKKLRTLLYIQDKTG